MAISRIASGSAEANTVTVPAHAIGDLIIIAAFRDGSVTPPSLPAGFTGITSGGDTASSMRVGYKVATSTSDTSGTWTNATELIVVIYRGQDSVNPIGDFNSFGGSGTTVTYPGIAMVITNGTSWVFGAGGHQSINTTIETPPTGMALVKDQLGATAEEAFHDTNAGVSSWAQTNVAVGGTSAGWFCIAAEIRAAASATINPDMWTPQYPSLLPRVRPNQYRIEANFFAGFFELITEDKWEPSFPDIHLRTKDKRYLYPETARDLNPIITPETVTSDKWTGEYPDYLPRSKDRRAAMPTYFKDLYFSEFLLNKWQPDYPDYINRTKDRRYLSPELGVKNPYYSEFILMKWQPQLPDVINRTKDRRYLPGAVFMPPQPIELITLDKWQGSREYYPTRPYSRRHLYPQAVRLYPDTVPVIPINDLRWLGNYPAHIFRPKSRHASIPYAFMFDGLTFTYCDPLSLWVAVDAPTSLWANADATETSLWQTGDPQSTFWSQLMVSLDTWDSETDTWDSLTDTWDALITDDDLVDDPEPTEWTPTEVQTTKWDPKCANE